MDSSEANLGKLTEESIKRKERLRKLREQVQKTEKSHTSDAEEIKLPK